MPNIEAQFREEFYEPIPVLPVDDSKRDKIKKIDLHLKEIQAILSRENLQHLDDITDQKTINSLKLIANYIEHLILLIDDSETTIATGSHFEDQLGQFCVNLAILKRILNKKAGPETIKAFAENAERFQNYFNACANLPDFLKDELGSRTGRDTH